MDINQIKFEKKLAKHYLYFEKNKELFDKVAILMRIFYNNRYDEKFQNEVYKKKYFSKRVLKSIIEYSKSKLEKLDIKELSLYEKEFITNKNQNLEKKKELLFEQLKVMYFLKPSVKEIKEFELLTWNKIHNSIFYEKNIDDTLKYLVNFNFKILNEIEKIEKKVELRCYILMINSLIKYESLNKNIDEFFEKYQYKKLVFLEELMRENFGNISEREIIILKDILKFVFNRRKIEAKVIEPIYQEVLLKYLKKINLDKDDEMFKFILYKKLKKDIKKNNLILDLN